MKLVFKLTNSVSRGKTRQNSALQNSSDIYLFAETTEKTRRNIVFFVGVPAREKGNFDRVNSPSNVNIKLDIHTPVYTPSHMHGTHMHATLSHSLTHVPQNVYAHESKNAH